MEQAGERARCIDLFPLKYSDGEVQYVAWPQMAAAAAVELVRRGAISAGNWLAGFRPETLLSLGCGVAALCVLLADGRSERRRR
jgi:hypothetical protein